MGRKFGFSFSWKRAAGISRAKSRISRKTGIPLTKSGRRRKARRMAGCFVATATYGDKNSMQVQFLRTFRDEILLRRHLGRFLIWLYYKGSPFASWLVEKVPILKSLTRSILDRAIDLIEKHTHLRQEAFHARKGQRN
jgi:hypothetical protein